MKRVIVGTTAMEKDKNADDRFTLQSSDGIGHQRIVWQVPIKQKQIQKWGM
ncbi:hypothetical protein [Caballeronia glebae]|uniref:hypothetical protein n=1 Tax=Caballeronia glebae TaxID=1777143 RepID=UPI0038B99608